MSPGSFSLTLSDSEDYRESLNSILVGPISILLRHRLQCYIVPHAAKSEHDHKGPMLVLNEVTIDRGDSSFLTNLECYCDDSFLTYVQGDGLILSTTSGSTAYSLAAGGSVVHPQVPSLPSNFQERPHPWWEASLRICPHPFNNYYI